MTRNLLACCFILSLLPAVAFSGEIVPNTFSAGQTISASQMNENFSALESKFSSISVPRYVDANGKLVGIILFDRLLGMSYNQTKFIIFIEADDFNLYGMSYAYASSDCTGTPYICGLSSVADLNIKLDNLYGVGINKKIYILDESKQLTSISALSIYDSGDMRSCQSVSPPAMEMSGCFPLTYLFDAASEFVWPLKIVY